MAKASIYQLRVVLEGFKPPVWRRLLVPADYTLGDLHHVLQAAFQWTDCHLHGYVLHDRRLRKPTEQLPTLNDDVSYLDIMTALHGRRSFGPARTPFGDPLDGVGDDDEDTVTLADVLTDEKIKLVYTYDFGDNWDHTIQLQKKLEPEAKQTYPTCTAGKRASPPEDCGGPPGYLHLVEALADENHADHEDLMEWHGEAIDPEAFDLDEVNADIARVAESIEKAKANGRGSS